MCRYCSRCLCAVSYWFDKPWFLTEGNTICYYTTSPFLFREAQQLIESSRRISGAVAGEASPNNPGAFAHIYQFACFYFLVAFIFLHLLPFYLLSSLFLFSPSLLYKSCFIKNTKNIVLTILKMLHVHLNSICLHLGSKCYCETEIIDRIDAKAWFSS